MLRSGGFVTGPGTKTTKGTAVIGRCKPPQGEIWKCACVVNVRDLAGLLLDSV